MEKEDIILSPIQQKEIEEAKKKKWEEKRDAFSKELDELSKKHGVGLIPMLDFNVTGIKPTIAFAPRNDKESK